MKFKKKIIKININIIIIINFFFYIIEKLKVDIFQNYSLSYTLIINLPKTTRIFYLKIYFIYLNHYK